MLFERHVISLSSLVEADKSGLRAIVRVCENLIEGKPLTVDELWPGDTPELSGCVRLLSLHMHILRIVVQPSV